MTTYRLLTIDDHGDWVDLHEDSTLEGLKAFAEAEVGVLWLIVDEQGFTKAFGNRLGEYKPEPPTRKAYALVQEGGTSTELYLHSHESVDEAEADRRSCATGAYRTSDIIEHTIVTLNGEEYMRLEDAYELTDAALGALGTLTTVDYTHEDESDYDGNDDIDT